MAGKLTAKQTRFVAEYLVTLNASEAARRAGYSPKTAFRSGQQNMQKCAVTTAIAVELAKRAKRTEIDQDYVLSRISLTVAESMGEEHRNPQAALKGLELLGRHLAMFTDKTLNKHSFDDLTDEEIAAKLAEHADRSPAARVTH